MCPIPPNFVLQKNSKFLVFSKNGPKRQKMKIWKKYCQNQKGLQKLETKHVPHVMSCKPHNKSNLPESYKKRLKKYLAERHAYLSCCIF